MTALAWVGAIVLFCALVALCAAVIHICALPAVDAIVEKVRNLHASRREYREWIKRHPGGWDDDGCWSRRCGPSCCYYPRPPEKDFYHGEID